MPFYSGTRDANSKKGAASKKYKEKLDAKMRGKPLADADPQEVYKRMIEERMAKMMEDILLGKRKNATVLPGTKAPDESAPKELSKTTMMMLRMLAERRAQKDRKALRKREIAYANAEKEKIRQQKLLEQQAELLLKQKEAEYQAAEAAKQAAYWAAESEKKDGWW